MSPASRPRVWKQLLPQPTRGFRGGRLKCPLTAGSPPPKDFLHSPCFSRGPIDSRAPTQQSQEALAPRLWDSGVGRLSELGCAVPYSWRNGKAAAECHLRSGQHSLDVFSLNGWDAEGPRGRLSSPQALSNTAMVHPALWSQGPGATSVGSALGTQVGHSCLSPRDGLGSYHFSWAAFQPLGAANTQGKG